MGGFLRLIVSGSKHKFQSFFEKLVTSRHGRFWWDLTENAEMYIASLHQIFGKYIFVFCSTSHGACSLILRVIWSMLLTAWCRATPDPVQSNSLPFSVHFEGVVCFVTSLRYSEFCHGASKSIFYWVFPSTDSLEVNKIPLNKTKICTQTRLAKVPSFDTVFLQLLRWNRFRFSQRGEDRILTE